MKKYTNDELKQLIGNINEEIIQKKNELSLLHDNVKLYRKLCNHSDLTINDWGSADCKICGKHLSWYCPTSPTLECNYEQEDGSYNEDSCRYCGDPEERK